jgi:D-aspartate ligase
MLWERKHARRSRYLSTAGVALKRHAADPVPEADAPVLLTMAGYHGTIAATRCLGANGIDVTIADPRLFAAARWSRFARRRAFCPPAQDADRLIGWLLEFGARTPGHVLYPTSDDLAWLYALHRDELAKNFRMYQPPVSVVYTLLNKHRLIEACRNAGIEMPQTWVPRDPAELELIEPELSFPLLVKPQTHILYWPHAKGLVATSRAELRTAYRQLQANSAYSSALLEFDPGVREPLLQVYYGGAAERIYTLSGFLDESGELFSFRASRKILQRPRQLGVGLCFEEAEVKPALAQRILGLCRMVGYYGVFEAEFIEDGERDLLIDFNPRFYGQMVFDVARGMPLPLFVYHAALKRQAALRAAVDLSGTRGAPRGWIYCNRLDLELMIGQLRLGGGMSAEEAKRWRSWPAGREKVIDAILDSGDRGPAFAHLATLALGYLRHPRSFLEHMRAKDREPMPTVNLRKLNIGCGKDALPGDRMPGTLLLSMGEDDAVLSAAQAGEHPAREFHLFRAIFERTLSMRSLFPSRLDSLAWQLRFSLESLRAARSMPSLRLIFFSEEIPGLFTLLGLRLLRRKPKTLMLIHNVTSRRRRLPFRVFGLARDLDHVFCLSQASRDVLRDEYGFPEEKITVLLTRVDTEFFSPRPAPPGARPVIASAGMVNRDYRTLIKACSGLDVDLKIAADTPWRYSTDPSQYADLAEMVQGNPRLEMRSWGNYGNLRELYAQASVVVVPLHDVGFASGQTVILEAMAMGKPVITSYIRGHSDFIEDGVTGIYVPPSDPAALHAAIEGLLREPGRAAALGRRARAAVEGRHGIVDYVNAVLRPCLALLGGGSQAPQTQSE